MSKHSLIAVFAIAGFALPATPRAADTGSIPAPHFTVGDTWTVDRTVQKGTTGFSQQRLSSTVDRVQDDFMLVGVKVDGAPSAAQETRVGLDWSLRLVNDDQEEITARPLSFPLKVGDSWTADWTDPRHQGLQTSAHFHRTYKVVGWKDVTTPAGVFHAVKIEANGAGDAQIQAPAVAQNMAAAAPGDALAISHVQAARHGTLHSITYSELYYAPEVKQLVKVIDEEYNASNVMTLRDTQVLASYHLAG